MFEQKRKQTAIEGSRGCTSYAVVPTHARWSEGLPSMLCIVKRFGAQTNATIAALTQPTHDSALRALALQPSG